VPNQHHLAIHLDALVRIRCDPRRLSFERHPASVVPREGLVQDPTSRPAICFGASDPGPVPKAAACCHVAPVASQLVVEKPKQVIGLPLEDDDALAAAVLVVCQPCLTLVLLGDELAELVRLGVRVISLRGTEAGGHIRVSLSLLALLGPVLDGAGCISWFASTEKVLAGTRIGRHP
jgi:hypothetical protein